MELNEIHADFFKVCNMDGNLFCLQHEAVLLLRDVENVVFFGLHILLFSVHCNAKVMFCK